MIGYLINPNNAQAERGADSAQQAANAKGLQLEILKAGTEAEIDAAFATAVQQQSEPSSSAIRYSTAAAGRS